MKLKTSSKEYLEYYKLQNKVPVIVKNWYELLRCLKNKKLYFVISDNNAIRKICNVLKIQNSSKSQAEINIEQYYSMIDALNVLSAKQIPVLFYNRIGLKKEGYKYSKSAANRMKHKIDIVKMTGNVGKYKKDIKELLGNNISQSYLEELLNIPQIIKKNNVYLHQDCSSELINIIEGQRVVKPFNDAAIHYIHVYGRCGVFGYAVSDENTLPSKLQKELMNKNYNEYQVINHGLWGGEDRYILNNFFYELSNFKQGDIVIFYMAHFEQFKNEIYQKHNMYYKDITDEWHRYPQTNHCFYDKPGHMNATGYGYVSEIILKDLINNQFGKNLTMRVDPCVRSKFLTDYVKSHNDLNFANEVDKYIKLLCNQNPILKRITGRIGCIVMNCNPFTLGHRFLIEKALGDVDWLLIFVVEENSSFFEFEDRFQMVKDGTDDLENVIVVPSGKFIISTLTFPEYFLKDYVKERDFDLTKDLETFCRYIAPALNISVRFAGEEPFDIVTNTYNQSMIKILPQNGIEFKVIPRCTAKDTEEVINATKVRKLIQEHDEEKLRKLVPNTTLRVILEKYMK